MKWFHPTYLPFHRNFEILLEILEGIFDCCVRFTETLDNGWRWIAEIIKSCLGRTSRNIGDKWIIRFVKCNWRCVSYSFVFRIGREDRFVTVCCISFFFNIYYFWRSAFLPLMMLHMTVSFNGKQNRSLMPGSLTLLRHFCSVTLNICSHFCTALSNISVTETENENWEYHENWSYSERVTKGWEFGPCLRSSLPRNIITCKDGIITVLVALPLVTSIKCSWSW